MVCTKCGKPGPTHHICSIIEGTKEILELCDKCAAIWNENSIIQFPDIREATCFYCGANATSGTLNEQWERDVRGQDCHFTCSTCLEMYHKRMQKSLEKISSEMPPDDQMRELVQAVKEVDKEVHKAAQISKN